MAHSSPEDLARLAAALTDLQAAAGPAGPEGRLIFPAAERSAQAAVLREIDQTVLRRRLCFTNDRDEKILLAVVERQVESGADVSGNTASAGRDPIRDETGLRDLLAGFAAGSARIAVVSEIAEEGAFGASCGVSVADLAAVSAPDDVADLCNEMAQLCRGIAAGLCVVSATGRSAAGGDADWGTRLERLCQDLNQSRGGDMVTAPHPRLVIWHRASRGGVSIASLFTADGRIWIAFDTVHLTELLSRLRSRYAF